MPNSNMTTNLSNELASPMANVERFVGSTFMSNCFTASVIKASNVPETLVTWALIVFPSIVTLMDFVIHFERSNEPMALTVRSKVKKMAVMAIIKKIRR